VTILFLALALGATAIPGPTAIPPWRPDTCTEIAYAPFDTPNIQITALERHGSDVFVKFRAERFVADPDFPNVSDRGLIYVQLDDYPATYLGTRTRPEEDVVVAYTNLKPGRHRIAIELISAHRTRPSVAVKCFGIPS